MRRFFVSGGKYGVSFQKLKTKLQIFKKSSRTNAAKFLESVNSEVQLVT